MENYWKPYGDIELQRRMVSDRPRTDAFAAAIHEVVQAGDVVLDVGTGTGILAMFAAQAGAKKVYAIEATDIAETAAALVKTNGFSGQIQVIRGRAGEVPLAEKVDLLISEWLGIAAFVEGMLYAVLDARDQSLGPNGRMMPSKVCVLLAPLDDPILYHNDGPGFWREPIHNLDLSSLQEIELAQGRTMQIRVEPAALLAPGQSLLELDLLTASEEDVSFDGQLEFVPVRDGVLNGFCVWFTAELSPHVHLDTGPLNPETHWAQTYVSFAPRIVRAGERLTVKVDFSYQPDPGYVDLRLSVGDDHLRCLID